MINFDGLWTAHLATDELRRKFAERDFDDSSWVSIQVPGHWRNHPEFARNDSPVLQRRAFTYPKVELGKRAWVRVNGLFYQGDVWLDGAYIGDTEGYFVPHTFEVTDALRQDEEHLLGIETTCSPQTDRVSKRNLTGVFQHWDCIDPDWNPGGIWLPVEIYETGPVQIEKIRVLCKEASTERAVVGIRAVLQSSDARRVLIRTRVGNTLHEKEHELASGQNRVEWRVNVERPKLWWPHALGQPNLVECDVQIIDRATEQVSDQRTKTIGLRQVRMKNWILEVNGERLHLKGANLGPTRMAIGNATPEELHRDLELAKDAGLDFVRMHAHVSHPALYEAADRLGMLIWQDMPLQWGYARSVRKQAVRQAGELVDLLGHHPSIFHWCGHNEPLALNITAEASTGSPKKAAEMMGKFVMLQELPTWNKSVLDFGIHRALTKADSTRPATSHSGILPGPFSGGTDSHLYFGWYHGNERDLPRLLGLFPRMARFISEFGAQALPVDSSFCEPENWPDLDWERLGHDHAMQKVFFDRNVPPASYVSFADWKLATQHYQAELLRRHIEELRRIKYRPNGGFAMFSLADALDHPAVTWSVLGHDRQPKLGFEAVQEACRPVIVTMDRPPATVAVGDTLGLDVHVVSDLRHTLSKGVVTATIRWPGGSHKWQWQGKIPADTCTRIGAIDFVVPSPAHPSAHHQPSEPHTLELDLVLDHAEATASNRYVCKFV